MSVRSVLFFFKDLPVLIENQSAWQQDREVGDDSLFDLPKKDLSGVFVFFKHCEVVKQGLVCQNCKRLQREQEAHLFDRLNLAVKPVIVVFLEEVYQDCGNTHVDDRVDKCDDEQRNLDVLEVF